MIMGLRIPFFRCVLLAFLPGLLIGDRGSFHRQTMISIERLKQHVQNLHFGRNPYAGYQKLEQAAGYIDQEFSKAGLRVWKEPFWWEGRWFHNVVAEKEGISSKDKVILLGAHYDTVENSPGADDNASGVAVLLEVARAVQAEPLAATVKFVAFGLEEYGYAGSTHYAEKARREGEKIVGMISLEMIGFTGPKQKYPSYVISQNYPAVGNFIGIIGNEGSRALFERVHQSFVNRAPHLPTEALLVPGRGEGFEGVRLSDHSSFWDQGFPAVMVTDTAFLRNPNYHLPTDTIETLDFEFMRNVAEGISFAILELVR